MFTYSIEYELMLEYQMKILVTCECEDSREQVLVECCNDVVTEPMN